MVNDLDPEVVCSGFGDHILRSHILKDARSLHLGQLALFSLSEAAGINIGLLFGTIVTNGSHQRENSRYPQYSHRG